MIRGECHQLTVDRDRGEPFGSRRVKILRRTQIAVKTLDLRLTRLSHLSRLISLVGIGNWRFSTSTMSFLLQPWHMLLAALCGMVNQRQQQIIEFQNAQIEALLKKLGKKRLLLDDDQRRLLAVIESEHRRGRRS